jgi:antitoxin component YwqK of YwqJK toxin-antitoxin module
MREFWEEGQIKSKSQYVNGQKQGERIAFWPGGELCATEEYDRGLLRKGRYYQPSQELIAEVNQAEGVCAHFDGERLVKLCEIQRGVVEGLMKVFDEQGQISSQYHLKEGRRQGEEVFYYPGTLKPKISLSWDADTLHGAIRTWYSNNQQQSEREMVRNKRTGPSLAWYRDGSLMLVEEYESDRLEKGRYYRKKGRDPVSTVTNGNGVATLYDEDGVLLHKVQYIKGKPIDPD